MTHSVKEATGLSQDPSPLRELHLALLQGFVGFIQRRNPVLQLLTLVGQLVDLGGGGRGEGVVEVVDGAHGDFQLVHLRPKETWTRVSSNAHPSILSASHTKLSFHVIQSANLLGKGTLKSGRLGVELDVKPALAHHLHQNSHL